MANDKNDGRRYGQLQDDASMVRHNEFDALIERARAVLENAELSKENMQLSLKGTVSDLRHEMLKERDTINASVATLIDEVREMKRTRRGIVSIFVAIFAVIGGIELLKEDFVEDTVGGMLANSVINGGSRQIESIATGLDNSLCRRFQSAMEVFNQPSIAQLAKFDDLTPEQLNRLTRMMQQIPDFKCPKSA